MASALYSFGGDDNNLLILNHRKPILFFNGISNRSKVVQGSRSHNYVRISNNGKSKVFATGLTDDVKFNCSWSLNKGA